jgi:hypothetical protein
LVTQHARALEQGSQFHEYGGGFGYQAFAQQKPNILVIWGDEIGQSNISVYPAV